MSVHVHLVLESPRQQGVQSHTHQTDRDERPSQVHDPIFEVLDQDVFWSVEKNHPQRGAEQHNTVNSGSDGQTKGQLATHMSA